jgi:transposase-like protein
VDVPRDRNDEFEPKLVLKYQCDISGIEEKVISLYARGMGTQDIHDQLKDLYGIEPSVEMVSRIMDKILPQAKEWQSRPLAPSTHSLLWTASTIKCGRMAASSAARPMSYWASPWKGIRRS